MTIQFKGKRSEWFQIIRGVPQGDPLSPLLFSLYMTFLFGEYIDNIREKDAWKDRGVQLYTIPMEDRPVLLPWPEIIKDTNMEGGIRKELRHVIPYIGKDTLHQKAEEFILEKIMYADDTIVVNTSQQQAIMSTQYHQRAAKVGGLDIHPDKLAYMILRGDNEEINEMTDYIIDDTKVKRKKSELHLGSRFTETYDNGNMNIKQRIATAKRKLDTKLAPIMDNNEMQVNLKIIFYISDILPVLLHGIEYWNINKKLITKINNFQRKALLTIVHRSYQDKITNVELYEWLHKRGFKTYPLELIIAERKLRYFGQIVREGIRRPQELTSKIFWSDVNKKCESWQHMDYQHITDIKKALALLGITEVVANKEFVEKNKWESILRSHKTGLGFEMWKDRKNAERERRHERNTQNKNKEDTEETNIQYIRRPLI
jgi:hypothetical protein